VHRGGTDGEYRGVDDCTKVWRDSHDVDSDRVRSARLSSHGEGSVTSHLHVQAQLGALPLDNVRQLVDRPLLRELVEHPELAAVGGVVNGDLDAAHWGVTVIGGWVGDDRRWCEWVSASMDCSQGRA
jgi:hypothetical protein